MDSPDVKRCLAYLGAAYGRSFDEVETAVWGDALGDLPYDETLEAIRNLVRWDPYLPQPSRVRAQVREVQRERREEAQQAERALPAPPGQSFEDWYASLSPERQESYGVRFLHGLLAGLGHVGHDSPDGPDGAGRPPGAGVESVTGDPSSREGGTEAE